MKMYQNQKANAKRAKKLKAYFKTKPKETTRKHTKKMEKKEKRNGQP